jgi:hypothetical protein
MKYRAVQLPALAALHWLADSGQSQEAKNAADARRRRRRPVFAEKAKEAAAKAG